MKLPKDTDGGSIAHGRWYDDACSAAFALEILGERWSMLVVRELMLGPRRFSDLRGDLPGISAKVLTQRLETLQQHDVIRRRRLPPPAAAQVYELTEWGYLAERPLLEMCRWGVMSHKHDPLLPISPTALMLSLRTMLLPERAPDASIRIGFEVSGAGFVGTVEGGLMHVCRGDPAAADITFRASAPHAILAAFYGKAPLDELRRKDLLSIEGDIARAEQVRGLFELPPKMSARAG